MKNLICFILAFISINAFALSGGNTASWESAFGNSMTGDNTGLLTPNKTRVTSYDLIETAWIKRFRAYIQPGSTNQKITVVLYAENAGAPGNLITSSNEVEILGGTTPSWVTFTLNEPKLLTPGKYWIGLLSGDSTSPSKCNFFTSTRSRILTSDLYADGPRPVFGKPESVLLGTLSVYAIYQVSTPCYVEGTCKVELAWDANSDLVTGYKIYYGKTSRTATGFVSYDSVVDVKNVTQYMLSGFDRNDYYFTATAYRTTNGVTLESGYSNEVSVKAIEWVQRTLDPSYPPQAAIHLILPQ